MILFKPGYLIYIVALSFVLLLSGCGERTVETSTTMEQPAGTKAIVDTTYTGNEGAETDGVRMYSSVTEALVDVPGDNPESYLIYIKKGTYHEKLYIDSPYVTLVGEDRNETILTYDDASGTPKQGGGFLGTAGSASVTVRASHFRAENLTIQNSFDYMGNMAKADNDPTKIAAQAVALRTEEGSDQAYFHRVNILGYQDTLFVDYGMQYFKDCRIAGNVDFIFGGGQALFENCEIVSMDRGSQTNNGYITAPSTGIRYAYGLVFLNCKLLKETPEMADQSVALGRPWKSMGQAVYINTYMDSHISAKGWDEMGGVQPEQARFFEYGSKGPGAIQSESRKTLSDSEAAAFTREELLKGFDPKAYTPLK